MIRADVHVRREIQMHLGWSGVFNPDQLAINRSLSRVAEVFTEYAALRSGHYGPRIEVRPIHDASLAYARQRSLILPGLRDADLQPTNIDRGVAPRTRVGHYVKRVGKWDLAQRHPIRRGRNAHRRGAVRGRKYKRIR